MVESAHRSKSLKPKHKLRTKGITKRVSQRQETPENQDWLKRVGQLKSDFDKINLQVQHAMKSESVTYLQTAFHRVQVEVPKLIQGLESLPPQSDKRKQSLAVFIHGLKMYLESCQHMQKSLEYDNKQVYQQKKNLMKETLQILKQAQKILK
jgi:hypothetical protein